MLLGMCRVPALALIALLATPTSAAIFGIDDRVTAPPLGQMAAIGVVTGGVGVLYGSGFLIDDCNVLTARHVVGDVEQAVGRRLTFRSGAASSDGEVVAAGRYWRVHAIERPIGADWLLLRLDRCLGRQLGHLPLATIARVSIENPRIKIEAAGYPRDRVIATGLTVDPDCAVIWNDGARIAHDCASLPGNSGGPLLIWDGARWVAIGIVSAAADRAKAEPFQPAEVNLAVDMNSILAVVRSATTIRAKTSAVDGAQ